MDFLAVIVSACGGAFVTGIFALIQLKKKEDAERKKQEQKEESEQNKKLDSLNEKIDGLGLKLDSHIYEDAKTKADSCRYKILRFADDIRSGFQASDEHWTEILFNIDVYEKFCSCNPNYMNNKAKNTIKFLKNQNLIRMTKDVEHSDELREEE